MSERIEMPIMPLESSIEDLIASRRPGAPLERPFYTAPGIFEREMDRIFLRCWHLVGHAARIPKPGDYFVYGIGGESVILIRDRSKEIHGLFNVCRHRGSRICVEESGKVKRLVCPYHAWVYELDGTLLAARHMGQDFDSSKFGLHRGHVRVIEGLIFLSLAQTAPDFGAFATDVEPFLAPHGLKQAKVCQRSDYVVNANWKLVMENAWECYHCGPAHPEFGSVMSYVGAMDSKRLAEERAALTSEWEMYAQSVGHKTGSTNRGAAAWWDCKRIPIRRGFLTQSQDGKPVAPVMGSLCTHDGGVTGTMLYPGCFLVCSSDHAVLNRFTPLDPLHTEFEITWLVREDAVEGVDYDVEKVTWLWRVTGEQDIRLCENNQLGVNSRRYVPGQYSLVEQEVEQFIQQYLKDIA